MQSIRTRCEKYKCRKIKGLERWEVGTSPAMLSGMINTTHTHQHLSTCEICGDRCSTKGHAGYLKYFVNQAAMAYHTSFAASIEDVPLAERLATITDVLDGFQAL